MDTILEKALEFSNYRQSLSIQRKTLKEKMSAALTYASAGGIFKIDRELINFVQFLLDQGRESGIILIDENENPILIDDLNKFKNDILDRYFSATLEYYEKFEKIKSSRSVEKLLDL